MQSTQDEADRRVTVRRDQEGRVTVSVPVRFYRRNGRQTIVAESGEVESHNKDGHPNAALIKAIAKAYLWQEQLESGEYGTLEELGKAVGVDRTFVARTLRLNSLSPHLIEKILGGDEPKGMSLESLRKTIPEIWGQQTWRQKQPPS